MRFLSLLALLCCLSDATAGPLRNRRSAPSAPPVALESGESADDGLADVNAARAQMGLPAYIRDDGLTQAAKVAAVTRARWSIHGHLANDFQALPSGSTASAAGAGALGKLEAAQKVSPLELRECAYRGSE